MKASEKQKHVVSTYKDEAQREFHYVFIRRNTDKLLIHFTAFFGDWGDRKEFKKNYQGYFHRLRMLGDEEAYSVLFLCDQFGFTKNGTYYTGEKGDFFVERAMNHIILMCVTELNLQMNKVVMIGSSMGATAALKFGLIHQVKGIVALSPHIDLDICAAKQGRELHVAAILADGKVYSEENKVYTRQIENLIKNYDSAKKLPRLFIHSCVDDHGVHYEQVVPKIKMWKDKLGQVELDERLVGGHGSEYATKPLILDVIKNMYQDLPCPLHRYKTAWLFKPENEKTIKFQLKKLLRPYLKPILDKVRRIVR